MKKLTSIIIALVLTGCFSAKLLVPSQSDVDRVRSKFPNYTLTDLNHGKALFEQNCGKCHGLKNPSSRSEEKWREVVPVMVKKANKKQTVISAEDQEQILKYVITMSSAPKTK